MKIINDTMCLVDSCRAVFKKINIGYLVLVTVLVTSGVFGACPYIYGIQQEDSMKFIVQVHPNSSLAEGESGIHLILGVRDDWFNLIIKDGPNVVIMIKRSIASRPEENTAPPSNITIWLEASQAGLEINENEITITEWTRACSLMDGQYMYFSSNGSGVLKIRKEGTSFHGTASFVFTDPSIDTTRGGRGGDSNRWRRINWDFLLSEQEGALLFSNKVFN